MRIGPRDPGTHAPKVGHKQEVQRAENSANVYQQRIMKVFNALSLYIFFVFRNVLGSRVVSRFQMSSERARSRRRASTVITSKMEMMASMALRART